MRCYLLCKSPNTQSWGIRYDQKYVHDFSIYFLFCNNFVYTVERS
jgi:hypothetical protein